MIKSYYPTAALTTRTIDTYYGAWKDTVSADEDIAAWYTVTADDTNRKLTLTPKADNITAYPVTITISTTALTMAQIFKTQTSQTLIATNHNTYAVDLKLSVYSDSDNIFIGIGSSLYLTGQHKAVAFGSTTAKTMVFGVVPGFGLRISDGTSDYNQTLAPTSYYRGDNIGYADNCIMSKYAAPAAGYMCKSVYTVDGGMSAPPALFTVSGKTFCKISSNVVCEIK